MLRPVRPKGVQAAMEYFTAQSFNFARSCTALKKAVETHQSIDAIRLRLAQSRLDYKRIESFLEYFFRSSSTIYNRPPKFEADEPDMEYQSPVGMQVIEAILYDKHPDYKALLQQVQAVESSASDLPALLYDFKGEDNQLLESLRIELVRIIALDITGYEAPLLKTGIAESQAALQSFAQQISPYLDKSPLADSLQTTLDKAIRLAAGPFDRFDRVAFLQTAMLPLQRQLGAFIRQHNLQLNTNKLLNYEADNLFSPDALRAIGPYTGIDAGSGARTSSSTEAMLNTAIPTASNTALIALGKQLFSDASLSGNGARSCATCHDPGKMFNDQLSTSMALDGHHHLDRNTPSLLYSAFQYRLFWDGHANTLEQQIQTVLYDQQEMNADSAAIARKGGTDSIARSIAAYLRTLHPMNSPFDHYLLGQGRPLTSREINGANLFLGKAQCATCHFAPLFNGLIPPDYALTEFEVLGTTKTSDFRHPKLSPDSGRYKVYSHDFYLSAFKTPTVRNAAVTFPYMHNGSLQTLPQLIEFYNKGGGQGLGLNVPDQTLSPAALHLSKHEEQDIILFLNTLTDSLNVSP